jgi:lipid-binding SYLF domain-containing protein
MTPKPSLKILFISLITILLISGQTSYSQTSVGTAARRSQNAAKTIEVVTGMPEDETIPVELLKRAQAIAVFPDVVETSMLFSKGMKGYGPVSIRQAEGWSLPAYYRYGRAKFTLKLAGFESFDLIILFMNKNVLDWFQEGRFEFKDFRAGVGGPVGKLTRQADLDMSGVGVIMYMLVDGKLKGMGVDSDFFDGSFIDPDNNINKPLYGMKGREVLQGKAPKTIPTAPGLTAFRDILNEKFPVSK